MNTFEKQYFILNEQQQKAVDTIDGPVFVMAGPGTGKTQILTLRIANILKETNGIDPENILALTFTNAAAYNMRERLSEIIGAEMAHRIHISTFHSFAESMIQQYDQYFERFREARLISPVEQIELIEKLADSHGGEYFSVFKRRSGTLQGIVIAIGKIKSEGLTVNEFRKKVQETFDEEMDSDEVRYKKDYGEYKKGDFKPSKVQKYEKKRDKNLAIADIFEAYEEQMKEQLRYDYADLITSVVQELKNDSLFQAELQEQFQYILVDEHQDTNDGQNAILSALIDNPVWEGKPNIFVVGDAKQSIFKFAGASQESFTQLFKKLKDVTTIELENNYRSHQAVLDHAQTLITKSTHHHNEPHLISRVKDKAGDIQYREFHSYKTEVLWVAQDIKERIEAGENADEIAVLFRNNADANDLRRLLDIYGITYHDHSKKNLLDDPGMLKLFLLLSVIEDIDNDEKVGKSLFIDFLNFNVIEVQKVLRSYRQQRSYESLFEFIAQDEKLKELDLSDEERDKYRSFIEMITHQKTASENIDFLSFFSGFIRESGFLNMVVGSSDSIQGLARLEKLFDEIRKEQLARNHFNFSNFMNYLATLKKQGITMDVGSPLTGGINLMTFHGSKGLEFETVYIIRALQKQKRGKDISLPFDDFVSGEAEDERRLLFVALTRAKKNCFLSSYLYSEEGKEKSRSIHINEIDDIAHIDMSSWEKEHVQDIADFFGASQQDITSLINQDYLTERFLKTKLSVSALNNYMKSPLLYFFRNLISLPQARSPFLDFGNLVHGTLEKFFDRAKEKGEVPDIEELKECCKELVESNYIYEPHLERALSILESYFNHYQGTFEVPLENEFRIKALSFETDSGHTINLTGVIDKITRNEDGTFTVWDYKTGSSYSNMDKKRKESIKRQASFYKLLLQHAHGGKYNLKEVIFDFIEENSKKKEYERQHFEITQEDVQKVKEEINELVNDVLSGTLLTADVPRDDNHGELVELLEIIKGPRTYEQPSMID